MTAPALRAVPVPDPDPDRRRDTLARFETMADLPRIDCFKQRGREPASARYTMELADGRSIVIGTINTLWSQAEMCKVLAVTIGQAPPPVPAADWRKIITAIINHAVDVDEATGEGFTDTVCDWLKAYVSRVGTDVNGACAAGLPFMDDAGQVHVHVASFAVYIRRHYSASIKEGELRVALGDLGFELRRGIHYTVGSKRSTTSYYHAHPDVLESGDVIG